MLTAGIVIPVVLITIVLIAIMLVSSKAEGFSDSGSCTSDSVIDKLKDTLKEEDQKKQDENSAECKKAITDATNVLQPYKSKCGFDKLFDATGAPVDWKTDLKSVIQTEVKNAIGETNGGSEKQAQEPAKYQLDKSQQSASNCPSQNTTVGLQQGADYRGAQPQGAPCPYAQAQTAAQCSQPQPVDMSEYIRKDSIPCWGCNIK